MDRDSCSAADTKMADTDQATIRYLTLSFSKPFFGDGDLHVFQRSQSTAHSYQVRRFPGNLGYHEPVSVFRETAVSSTWLSN